MNAAGMTFVLTGVSSALSMPFFQNLVTDGSIQQGELDGTQANLADVITTLRNTPADKIEAMVARYNNELTAHLNSFDSERAQDALAGFREAQVMAGYVTSIMVAADLSE